MDQNAYWQQQNHGQYHNYPNTNQYDHQNSGYYDPNLHYANQAGPHNAVYAQNSQGAVASNDWENNWSWGEEENSNYQGISQPNDVQNVVSNTNRIEENFVNDETWNWSVDDSKAASAQFLEQPINNTNQEFQSNVTESIPSVANASTLNHSKNIKVETKQPPHQFADNAGPSVSKTVNTLLLDPAVSDPSVNNDISTVSNQTVEDMYIKQEVQDVSKQVDMHFVSQDASENSEILSNIKHEYPTHLGKPPIPNHTTQPSPAQPPKYSTSLSASSSSSFAPVPQTSSSTEDTKSSSKQLPKSTVAGKFPSSPGVASQDYKPSSYQLYSQPVNLETLPDNSERPDQNPLRSAATIKKLVPVRSQPQQWQENNEVPINDRNQYLETGRLSAVDAPDALQDPNDTLPPPGLRRMVLGQIEQHESNPPGSASDEPPPGWSRMVLGQRESNMDDANQSSDDLQQPFNTIEPPEGLHRMVPGESSSPESTSRQQQYPGDHRRDDDSDYRYNQVLSQPGEPRSATLGADTPPIVAPVPGAGTRSDIIIGANTPPSGQAVGKGDGVRVRSQNMSNENRIGAVGLDSSSISGRSKDANAKKHEKALIDDASFRDPIEGETQETIASIVTSIRNLTVGENVNDDLGNSDRDRESKTKHSSRQESSDSDPELRSHRDERYRKRNEKHRKDDRDDGYERDNELPRDDRHDPDRYTPEYRDKKYSSRRRYKDRRFDDETDYYSDRERDRRGRDDRMRDRNYGSLQRDKDRRRRDPRDLRDPRDARDPRDPRDPRDTRDLRDVRDVRDPRDRDYERDYRRNYYYNRYETESLNESQSRASSRSDSVHNAYRDRGYDHHRSRDSRHHDKTKQGRYRDPFVQYSQGFAYDPYSQYYQQYQYYENLRRTNPQAYAEFYRKYYQQQAGQVAYDNEDRASVHSGRSSANEGAARDRYPHSYDYTDTSMNLDDTHMTSQRSTPVKFATAHVNVSIASGKLVRVFPHFPMDGQSATVDICNIESAFLNDDECKELALFPGPLVRGTTHKKTIIEYCETKIKVALFSNIVDTESYVLLWELLILLIRQNGMVVGADIAELLLKNRNSDSFQRPLSVSSSISSSALDVNTTSEGGIQHLSDTIGGSAMSVLKESEITNKFREYLLYGSVREALEWAMKNSLWGHALFLASKLDKRTYASVITRFANGLSLNDPLQTLYQLLSGRTPAVVTCIADEKWGDWRPHLAMILSNTTQYPELNCKAVTTLGDTLSNRGCIYAAQFCYLMAEVGFGSYGDPSSKLVLLGSDHTKPFDQFATNEAIHMTEIYEYACSLNNPEFTIPNFQAYKYIAATRLADCSLLDKSLAYLERIAGYIVVNAPNVDVNLATSVHTLADRLKYHDLFAGGDEDGLGDADVTNRPDSTWLKDLTNILYAENVQPDNITQEQAADPMPAGEQYDNGYDLASQQQQLQQQTQQPEQQQWQPDVQYAEYQGTMPSQPYITEQAVNSEEHFAAQNQFLVQQPNSFPATDLNNQQPMWQPQTQWEPQGQGQYQDDLVSPQTSYFRSANEHVASEPVQRPQISMPNQSKLKSAYDDSSEDKRALSSPAKSKPNQTQQEDGAKGSAGTGWFGGIFSRLAPKPKNQMKLPDDTNPTIVWDAAKKRWVNNDDDGSSGTGDFKPPPRMSDLAPRMPTPPEINAQLRNIPDNAGMMAPLSGGGLQQSGMPDMSRQAPVRSLSNGSQNGGDVDHKPVPDPNMFRLHGRSRNLKKSYVDVFNPGKKAGGGQPMVPVDPSMGVPGGGGGVGHLPQVPNFFVPQQVSDPNAPTDFLTPSLPYASDNPQGD